MSKPNPVDNAQVVDAMADALHLHPRSVIGRCPGQLAGEIDGQVVLLSIETGYYFHFNAVGSRIWSLIEIPTTLFPYTTLFRSTKSVV